MESESPQGFRSTLKNLFRSSRIKHTSSDSLVAARVYSSMKNIPVTSPVPDANGNDVAEGFGALAAHHSPIQAPSGIGFDQMKFGLDIVSSLGEGPINVPGLKAICQLALQIIKRAETADDNNQLCYDVAYHAYQLFQLFNNPDLLKNESIQSVYQSMANELKDVEQAIRIIASRKTPGQLWHAEDDKGGISRCTRFLDWTVDRVQIQLQLANHQKLNIGLQRLENIENQMARLPPKRKDTITELEFSTQLPPPPPIFLGREDLLTYGSNSILGSTGGNFAITGAGGMGKTSLSLALLHEPKIKAHFGTHLHFVPCESVKNASQLMRGILLALGNSEKGQTSDPKKILLEVLGSADDLLLVLDNFETPWNESNDQRHIHDILKMIAALLNVTLIITTRVTALPSGIKWASFLPDSMLPPLELKYARMVFLQEAGLNIENHLQESKDLDTLLAEVDCIPLAVSLLSRVSRQKSPTTLLKRWREQRTSMLKAVGHSTSRLNSVEVSVEISIKQLKEPDEIKLLGLLSFLPRGILNWETELTEMDIGLQNPIELVEGLLAASLLQDTNGWLQMLSPVQHYVKRVYGQGSIEELRRLTGCFTSWINARQGKQVMEKLLEQTNNICAVLIEGLHIFATSDHWVTTYTYSKLLLNNNKSDIELAETILKEKQLKPESISTADCLVHMGAVYEMHFKLKEAQAASEAALEIFEASAREKDMAKCNMNIGRMLCRQHNYATAQKRLETAYDLYNAVGSKLGAANCLYSIQEILHLQSNHSEATKQLETAYELYKEVNSKLGMANCLCGIGEALLEQGYLTRAQEKIEPAYKLYEEIGNKIGMAGCLSNIGEILYKKGNYPAAQKNLDAANELYLQTGNKLAMANCICTIGEMFWRQGDYTKAVEKEEAGYELHAAIGNILGMAGCLRIMGDILWKQKNYSEAKKKLEEGYQLYNKIENRQGMANCLASLGGSQRSLKNYPEALEKLEAAVNLYSATGDKEGMIGCMIGIGRILVAQNHSSQALEKFESTCKECNLIDDKEGMADCLFNMGEILFRSKNYPLSLEKIHGAQKLYQTLKDDRAIADCTYYIGKISWKQGNHIKAQEHLEVATETYHTLGNPMRKAICLRIRGEIYYEVKDNRAAREKLEAAHRLFTKHHAKDQAAECLVLLQLIDNV
ncbi:hypothetical protein AMATHDRAFT_47464 [Amanita thiersii Skay4041]|uniref:ORC1/DEAH AAA+ ATPase domain-containing protein n=1 Tax=Amanita thiersii Skay4041 TaxID=703135 RepID=A0A2A9NT46_9AGAR|nr:hypothetical protein AMATHDRAFT_47464 [Amanita thiersii Skay4041]